MTHGETWSQLGLLIGLVSGCWLSIGIVACQKYLIPGIVVFPGRDMSHKSRNLNRFAEGGDPLKAPPKWLGGLLTDPGSNTDENTNLLGSLIAIDGKHLLYPSRLAVRAQRLRHPMEHVSFLNRKQNVSAVNMPMYRNTINGDSDAKIQKEFEGRAPIQKLNNQMYLEGDPNELRSFDRTNFNRPYVSRNASNVPDNCKALAWSKSPRYKSRRRQGLEYNHQRKSRHIIGNPYRGQDLRLVSIPVRISKNKCKDNYCRGRVVRAETDKICSDFTSDLGSPVLCGRDNMLSYIISGNGQNTDGGCSDKFRALQVSSLMPSLKKYIPGL